MIKLIIPDIKYPRKTQITAFYNVKTSIQNFQIYFEYSANRRGVPPLRPIADK